MDSLRNKEMQLNNKKEIGLSLYILTMITLYLRIPNILNMLRIYTTCSQGRMGGKAWGLKIKML